MLRGATSTQQAGPAARGVRGGASCRPFCFRVGGRSGRVAADPAAPLLGALAPADRDVLGVLVDVEALATGALGGQLAHGGQVLPGQRGLLGVRAVDRHLEGGRGLLDLAQHVEQHVAEVDGRPGVELGVLALHVPPVGGQGQIQLAPLLVEGAQVEPGPGGVGGMLAGDGRAVGPRRPVHVLAGGADHPLDDLGRRAPLGMAGGDGHPQGAFGPVGVAHRPQQLPELVGGPRRPLRVVVGDGRMECALGRLEVALAGEVIPHQEGALGSPTPFVAHAPRLPGAIGAVKAPSKGNDPRLYNGAMDGALPDRDLAAIGLLQDPVRRALYGHVVASGGEVSRNQAAEAAGVARSLAAFHLDKLVEAGLLEATFRRLGDRRGPGAGRPAKLYRRAAGEVAATLPPRTYETAAHLLAETVEQAGADLELQAAARRAGAEAGRRIAAEASAGPDPAPAVEQVLAARGYEPYRDGDALRLRNCPFANLSAEFPVLVCAMNLCLIEGLLDGLGQDPGRAVMDPAPDRCCVAVFSKDNQD